MEHTRKRQNTQTWIWALITVETIILAFVVWWAVATSQPEKIVIAGPPQEGSTSAIQHQQELSEQPSIVEPKEPVSIFIQREHPTKVIIVRSGQEPPQAKESLRKISLPVEFKYQNKLWRITTEAGRNKEKALKDIGAIVESNRIYAEQNDQLPYDSLYLETEKNSEIFVKYVPVRSSEQ
jgi:hypothetical protein